MTGPEEIARLAAEAPIPLRVLLGAIGFVLLVAGARVYRLALFGSVFTLAAIGAGLALAWGGTQIAALNRPEILALGSILTGAAAAGVAKMAHRVGLLAVGGVAGLALGAGIGDLVGGGATLWAPVVGVLAGAAIFPFVFQSLLKFITPLVGAVAIVFASGHPERLWVLGLLTGIGIVVQVGLLPKRKPATGE